MVMVVCFTSNDASLQIFLSWLAFTVYTFVRRFFWPYAKHVAAQPESGVFRATAKQMVVLTGWKLNILRWINFLPIVGGAYRSLQRKLLGLDDSVLFRFDFSHQPGTLQSNAAINSLNVIQAAKGAAYDESRLVPIDTNNGAGFRFPDFDAYRTAYMSGKTTPVDVAKRLVDAVAKSTGSGPDCVNAIIRVNAESFLREAEASRLRYVNGTTLSEFDGIPITVKDEFDVEGYRTSAGTEFLNRETLAKKDAVIVQRLRAKGFLIAGKANMMEIGIAPFGYNKFNGHCKSPYDTTCDSGGSSSGSAAAVGSGLVPAALGADGGGSIRVPSAFCGVVGLKANVNRVPECSGVFPLCFSVGHAGPIASNVKDAYAVFRIIQGPHEGDLLSGSVPVGIPRSLNGNTRWRIGVCEEWIALCTDKSISANFRQSLEQLQAAGATIVPFKIPVFEQIRLGHTVTILSEMLATMTPYDGELHHMVSARPSVISLIDFFFSSLRWE